MPSCLACIEVPALLDESKHDQPLTSMTSPFPQTAHPAKLTPEDSDGPGLHSSATGSYSSELLSDLQLPSWPPV